MVELDTTAAWEAASLLERVCPDLHPETASSLRSLANDLRTVPHSIETDGMTPEEIKEVAWPISMTFGVLATQLTEHAVGPEGDPNWSLEMQDLGKQKGMYQAIRADSECFSQTVEVTAHLASLSDKLGLLPDPDPEPD